MIAIFKKELWSYFGNWSAWVIIAAFSLIMTLFLFFFENDSNIFDIGFGFFTKLFRFGSVAFDVYHSGIVDETFAEEQQTGTLNWLFSQPLKVSELVFREIFISLGSRYFMSHSFTDLSLYSLCFGRSRRKYRFGNDVRKLFRIDYPDCNVCRRVGILHLLFLKTKLWLICLEFLCVSSCISG